MTKEEKKGIDELEQALTRSSFLILSRLQSGTERVVRLDEALSEIENLKKENQNKKEVVICSKNGLKMQ